MNDYVLVINAGSSSLKYSLVDAASGQATAVGVVEQIGEPQGRQRHRGPNGENNSTEAIGSHEDALRAAMKAFETYGPSLDDVELTAVGHRVVHGGSQFADPVLIDDDLIAKVT